MFSRRSFKFLLVNSLFILFDVVRVSSLPSYSWQMQCHIAMHVDNMTINKYLSFFHSPCGLCLL
jgi:hypothetical protein